MIACRSGPAGFNSKLTSSDYDTPTSRAYFVLNPLSCGGEPSAADRFSQGVCNDTICVDEILKNGDSGYDFSIGKIFGQVKSTNLRIEDNLIARTTNIPIDWTHIDSLNEVRNVLWAKLEALSLFALDASPATIQAGPQAGWAQYPAPCSCGPSLLQELVVSDAFDLICQNEVNVLPDWTDGLVTLIKRQLRYVVSLAHAALLSRRGLTDIVGVFVNERSWYLHHSAHPPEVSADAARGCFPATSRGACFQPQPA